MSESASTSSTPLRKNSRASTSGASKCSSRRKDLIDHNDVSALLDSPITRSLLMQTIAANKGDIEKFKRECKKAQKIQYRALSTYQTPLIKRRDKLKEMALSKAYKSSQDHSVPLPFQRKLEHVVAFVDVNCMGINWTDQIQRLMLMMGARVVKTFSIIVTHIIFQEGSDETFKVGIGNGCHMVSVLWLGAVKTNPFRVPEILYNALKTCASSMQMMDICKVNDKIILEINQALKNVTQTKSKTEEGAAALSCETPDYRLEIVNGVVTKVKPDERVVRVVDHKSISRKLFCGKNETDVKSIRATTSQEIDIEEATPESSIAINDVTEANFKNAIFADLKFSNYHQERTEKHLVTDKAEFEEVVDDCYQKKKIPNNNLRKDTIQKNPERKRKFQDDSDKTYSGKMEYEYISDKRHLSKNGNYELDNFQKLEKYGYFKKSQNPQSKTSRSSTITSNVRNLGESLDAEKVEFDDMRYAKTEYAKTGKQKYNCGKVLEKSNKKGNINTELANWNSLKVKLNNVDISKTGLWSVEKFNSGKTCIEDLNSGREELQQASQKVKVKKGASETAFIKNIDAGTSSFELRNIRTSHSQKAMAKDVCSKKTSIQNNNAILMATIEKDSSPQSIAISENEKLNLDNIFTPIMHKVCYFPPSVETEIIGSPTKETPSTKNSIFNSDRFSFILHDDKVKLSEAVSISDDKISRLVSCSTVNFDGNNDTQKKSGTNIHVAPTPNKYRQLYSPMNKSQNWNNVKFEPYSSHVSKNKSTRKSQRSHTITRPPDSEGQEQEKTENKIEKVTPEIYTVNAVAYITLVRAVNALGGYKANKKINENTTHFIMTKDNVNYAVLKAITKGCWVLHYNWLLNSLKMGEWVPEEEYEMRNICPSIQASRLLRMNTGEKFPLTLFQRCGPIYISEVMIDIVNMTLLIEYCRGKVSNVLEASSIAIEYYTPCNIPRVSGFWVINCIKENTLLSLDDYLLN